MTALTHQPLTPATWDAYAALVADHNGVWGGCWCMAFHDEGTGKGHTAEGNRAAKLARVAEGRAHAALVFDGATCVGWCQFGPPAELPRIKNQRAYLQGAPARPDWRITCFFSARSHRGRGVAAAALTGALDLIARAGGGLVEAFPEDTTGARTSSSFLYSGTLAMFTAAGFAPVRQLGKARWLVARQVAAAG